MRPITWLVIVIILAGLLAAFAWGAISERKRELPKMVQPIQPISCNPVGLDAGLKSCRQDIESMRDDIATLAESINKLETRLAQAQCPKSQPPAMVPPRPPLPAPVSLTDPVISKELQAAIDRIGPTPNQSQGKIIKNINKHVSNIQFARIRMDAAIAKRDAARDAGDRVLSDAFNKIVEEAMYEIKTNKQQIDSCYQALIDATARGAMEPFPINGWNP
jgi:hypothetical protein